MTPDQIEQESVRELSKKIAEISNGYRFDVVMSAMIGVLTFSIIEIAGAEGAETFSDDVGRILKKSVQQMTILAKPFPNMKEQ